jgi:glycosyltransferase involved in cell wall biosynthesis
MRICLITGEYPPMEGGVGAFTQALAGALKVLGHDLSIVTTALDADHSGKQAISVDEDGITVYRSVASWRRRGVAQAVKIVEEIAPDIINLQYEVAAYGMKGWVTRLPDLLQHRLTSPTCVTFHDLLPPYLFPKAGSLRQRSVWHLASAADGAIVTNAEDLQYLTAELQSRGSTTPVQMIPIGSNINTEVTPDYDREAYRARYDWGAGELVIGFFGFLNRSKGVNALIEALSLLRSRGHRAKLLFIGGRTGTSDSTNAAYAAEIDALIEELHLTPHIRRTGFASQEEVSAALYAVDVCALPYRDGANLRRGTLHAALAHGCAIVTTTPTAPLSELENDVHAIFVTPDSADALANALAMVGTDVALRNRLGKAAATLAQRFTWPQIAAESVAFFEARL